MDALADLVGLSPGALAFAAAAMVAGGFIRGYSGFGSSMFWVASISLVVPPAQIVPTIYLLEVLASARLLPGAWRDVAWRPCAAMLAGALVATPAGVWLLASTPERPMRIAIALLILTAVLVLWRSRGAPWRPTLGGAAAAGVVSGAINGATSMGGPPAVLYFMGTGYGPAAIRASLIAYLMGTDILAAAYAAGWGLIDGAMLARTGIFFLLVLVGLALGSRRFLSAPPEAFRRFVMVLLATLAAVGLARAAIF